MQTSRSGCMPGKQLPLINFGLNRSTYVSQRGFKLRPRIGTTASAMARELPSTYDDPVHIAIIGGTGLGSLPSPPFKPVATLPPPSTPWGLPSSPISILTYAPPTASSTKPIAIAFLARHGLHHQLAPHEIPNQANIAALRKLGVRCVVAFSAVGSLREEVKPRDFVVVDQVIDWTRGVSGLSLLLEKYAPDNSDDRG